MDVNKYKRANKAAATIQAYFRGFLQRRAYRQLQAATQKIQAHCRGWYTRRKVQKIKDKAARDKHFNEVMERHRERIYLLEAEKRELLSVPAGELNEWQARRHRAATKVQAHWRGLVERRKWAQCSPERQKRAEATAQVQKTYKQMQAVRGSLSGQLPRTAQGEFQEAPGSPPQREFSFTASTPVTGGKVSSRLLGLRTDQSASVLMGSPEPAVLSAEAAGYERRDGGEKALQHALRLSVQRRQDGPASYMSGKRYQDLHRQVDATLATYKAQAKNRRSDPAVVNARLKELLRSYNMSAESNIHAAHQRQQELVLSETIVAQLDGMVTSLDDLPPDCQPQDFPKPAKGSDRMAKASQAHALMLADVRAGSRWWTHLQALNQETVQISLLEEDASSWQAADQQWRRQWKAIELEEISRVDPDTGLHRGPLPPLSDIAITDEEDQRLRQQIRGHRQQQGMQAAMQAATKAKSVDFATKARSAESGTQQPAADRNRQSAVSYGLASEFEKPAHRPGSVPIIIPTSTQTRQQQTAGLSTSTPAVGMANNAISVSTGQLSSAKATAEMAPSSSRNAAVSQSAAGGQRRSSSGSPLSPPVPVSAIDQKRMNVVGLVLNGALDKKIANSGGSQPYSAPATTDAREQGVPLQLVSSLTGSSGPRRRGNTEGNDGNGALQSLQTSVESSVKRGSQEGPSYRSGGSSSDYAPSLS